MAPPLRVSSVCRRGALRISSYRSASNSALTWRVAQPDSGGGGWKIDQDQGCLKLRFLSKAQEHARRRGAGADQPVSESGGIQQASDFLTKVLEIRTESGAFSDKCF